MTDHYLKTAEVAARCRTSPSTVRYWHLTGYGPPSVKIGKQRLYPESGFLTWLREMQAAETADAAAAGSDA
jgi:DNA-binding transcriptional MerR regulator